MKIIQITERNKNLIENLLNIWESSVKATHKFLSPNEINNIKKYVPKALNDVPILIIAQDNNKIPMAFMGISNQKLEMLFVSNKFRKKGIGKHLFKYAVENYSINELCVNEQNPIAKEFYEHMGFEVYKRSELDEQGNPYPLLYMKRIYK